MKKITYFLAVIALALASCGGGKGYTVTGTVEGAIDGDTVFMMDRANRQFVQVGTAIIKDGKFTFTGVQDSVVSRYLVYTPEDSYDPLYLEFFLENGKTDVKFMQAEGADVISGTPTNDAFQAFNNGMKVAIDKQKAIYGVLKTAEGAEKESKMKEMADAEAEMVTAIKNGIQKNISTPLAVFLLDSYYYYMDYADLGALLAQLPEQVKKDSRMVRLQELVDTASKTAVGQKFIDLAMLTPDGASMKLSDYAGKGKLVLVDFWASWCGPCRAEMPKLVEAYAKYKSKGFEIVGVSFDRNGESWKKGIADLSITWPQMSDLKYWESEGAKLYAISSIPHTMLIDGEGTIIARGLDGNAVLAKLAELIK